MGELHGARLRFLLDTDRRLFAQAFTRERAAGLRSDPLLAERVDAFGAVSAACRTRWATNS